MGLTQSDMLTQNSKHSSKSPISTASKSPMSMASKSPLSSSKSPMADLDLNAQAGGGAGTLRKKSQSSLASGQEDNSFTR